MKKVRSWVPITAAFFGITSVMGIVAQLQNWTDEIPLNVGLLIFRFVIFFISYAVLIEVFEYEERKKEFFSRIEKNQEKQMTNQLYKEQANDSKDYKF